MCLTLQGHFIWDNSFGFLLYNLSQVEHLKLIEVIESTYSSTLVNPKEFSRLMNSSLVNLRPFFENIYHIYKKTPPF
jgi:hypothetical protein